jgi:hypothetical protein
VTRYFFDIVGQERSILDYAGQVLSSPRLAYDAAELLAMDLAVKSGDEEGLIVNVCSVEGARLFSIAVQPTCLAAPAQNFHLLNR